MLEKQIKCPRCGHFTLFDKTKNPFRPFCSERCQLIDLGNWADESYKVPIKNDEKTMIEISEILNEEEESEFS